MNSANRRRVPRLAEWIVGTIVPAAHREVLLGDLAEQHALTLQAAGARRARRRYWSQAARTAAAALSLRWRVGAGIAGAGRPRSGRFDMSMLRQDVIRGIRSLVRSPGYSVVSVLTLAFAIGANTLLFSIASPLVVRPLPLKDQDTLGWILMSHAERQLTRGRSSVPDYLEWRSGLRSFESLGAYGVRPATLTGHGDADRIQLARATANLPDIWGLRPVIGRVFQPGEDTPGRPLVGALSYRYWQSAFQGDAAVLGRSFLVDGQSITVVGVMPPSIELGTLSLIDIWAPLPLDPTTPRDDRWILPSGRLAAGVSVEQANAEFQTLFAGQQREHGRVLDGWGARVASSEAALASEDTWVLLALLAIVVGFVLLIACANLANLVMARLVARRQELDVRLALGASRWQVVRPWLVEGFIVSVMGGLTGLAIAHGGLRVINAVAFEAFFRQIHIDGYVLVFTAAISIATPLLFALWPAFSAGRRMDDALRHGSRVGGGRAAALRRNLLVGTQVALALALLVVSGLAVQSMLYVRRTDLGYDPRAILAWNVPLPADRYASPGGVSRFASDAASALQAGPLVRGVAFTSGVPVLDVDQPRPISGTLHDGDDPSNRAWASWYSVTPGFFETMGLSVMAGRGFNDADRAGAEPVALLNRHAAERYFDTLPDAIGRRVAIHDAGLGERPVTIVGIVADTRDNSVLRTGPQIYVPLAQWPVTTLAGVVRADEPLALAADVRATMRRLDPEVPVSNLKPLSQVIDEEMSSSAIISGLFVSFAVLALVLATAGLFAVISFSVGQRRREIGLRLALGAPPASVGRMVVASGLRVTLIGAAAGLLIGLALANAAASVLLGISPRDPATFGAATALVVIVALAACFSPAISAMRVDPARTLRTD